MSREAIEALQAERRKRWAELEQEVDQLADGLGYPIDPGIKEAVIALHAHGLETSQSCEGHDDSGQALPYVRVEADEPEGWEDDPVKQAAWKAENDRLVGRLQDLLIGWYDRLQADGVIVPADQRLELHPQGVFGAVRLEPARQDELTKLPAAQRSERAPTYRQEMSRFSSYLKERFLNGD